MQEISDVHCKFILWDLRVSVWNKFQADTSYRFRDMVMKGFFFTFLHSVTPRFKMATPKSIGIWFYPRQLSVPRCKFIALKLFELSFKTKFDLWVLSNLENQSYGPNISRYPRRSIGKLYTKFQIDSCKTFCDFIWEYRILVVICAALINRSLGNFVGAHITECVFP